MFLIQVLGASVKVISEVLRALRMYEVEFVSLNENIYRVRLLFLSKSLWDAFEVSKELVELL